MFVRTNHPSTLYLAINFGIYLILSAVHASRIEAYGSHEFSTQGIDTSEGEATCSRRLGSLGYVAGCSGWN
jgi:hypothetical protein